MAVSIVMPAYNEEAIIGRVIQRLEYALTKGSIDYEIIVVDNCSTDETHVVCSNFINVKVIHLDKKLTISEARNVGWRTAKYKIIAFIDADVLITDLWVNTLTSKIKELTASPNQITGYRYSLSENPSWIERSWFHELGKSKVKYINGGNLITTRNLLESLSGFDELLITGEDVDLCKRSQTQGALVKPHPGFDTHHEGNPRTLKQFFMRERWHGVGDMKSIKTFFSSKVSIVSSLVTGSLVASILLISAHLYMLGFTILASVIIANFFLVFIRFKKIEAKNVPAISFLNIVYFVARSLSFLYRTRI